MPEKGKNTSIKLALFDLDGTLTKERSAWEFIHRRLGVWEGQAEKYQAAFLKGEISYTKFCQLDAAIWKGMAVSQIEKILQEIPLQDGVEELLAYLRSKRVKLGIISSGLSLLANYLKKKYGMDYAVANELEIVDGRLTGGIKINVYYDRKKEWVEEAMRNFLVKREEIMAVGDSHGDIDMLQMAGLPIAFNSSSRTLAEIAKIYVESSDLRDLIPHLKCFLE
ncbi:MAG: HAD family hydrolase [Thermodesulfobacteriota bacterium]